MSISKVSLLKFLENAQKVYGSMPIMIYKKIWKFSKEILLKTTEPAEALEVQNPCWKKNLKSRIQVAKWQHPDPVNFGPWALKKTMLVPSGLLKSLMQWRWGFKVSSFPFIARLLCLLQGEEIEFHSIGGDDIVKRNSRLTQGRNNLK